MDSVIEADKKRHRSSTRMRYLAEVEILKRDLGSLEMVREKLGISQRKVCQMLLVDPSAWTRWRKDESKVPPHIWKMLAMHLDPKKVGEIHRQTVEIRTTSFQLPLTWKLLLSLHFLLTLGLLIHISLW